MCSNQQERKGLSLRRGPESHSGTGILPPHPRVRIVEPYRRSDLIGIGSANGTSGNGECISKLAFDY
ncbi:integrator complex subunit 9 [Echinococcus multilocularis]|uniref:Integrator complex subunit 9 n=1 Tax=Echinococcus multilocularis TaxID=6211 RepID=A0A0S4MLT8_ECHMU|nr:integrator complex subunit 9 [Echinococcus multilocularis]